MSMSNEHPSNYIATVTVTRYSKDILSGGAPAHNEQLHWHSSAYFIDDFKLTGVYRPWTIRKRVHANLIDRNSQ